MDMASAAPGLPFHSSFCSCQHNTHMRVRVRTCADTYARVHAHAHTHAHKHTRAHGQLTFVFLLPRTHTAPPPPGPQLSSGGRALAPPSNGMAVLLVKVVLSTLMEP